MCRPPIYHSTVTWFFGRFRALYFIVSYDNSVLVLDSYQSETATLKFPHTIEHLMARLLSAELQRFYAALPVVLAVVGLCTIPAEVQCSSRGVYRYLRAQVANGGVTVSPQATPLESWHQRGYGLASPREELEGDITAFFTSMETTAQKQQLPGPRLSEHNPRSTFSMLPRGSVYLPPGPSLGSNTVVPPPDR